MWKPHITDITQKYRASNMWGRIRPNGELANRQMSSDDFGAVVADHSTYK